MIFLQTHTLNPKNSEELIKLENPIFIDTITKMEVDFFKSYITYINPEGEQELRLDCCYQSRPLIEIDGFCEFDIVLSNEYYQVDVTSTKIVLFLPSLIIKNLFDHFYEEDYNDRFYTVIDGDYKNLGSIFKPKNQAKYPDLYQKALEIIAQ